MGVGRTLMPTRDAEAVTIPKSNSEKKREEGLQKRRAMAAAPANANTTLDTTETAMITIVNTTGTATTAPSMKKVWNA